MVTQPGWNQVLQALREAGGVTQEGWAARLGYSRRTIQRWEQGGALPDAAAEAALAALCEERGLFRAYDRGPLAGLVPSRAWLQELLAAARLGAALAYVPGSTPSAATAAAYAIAPASAHLPAALSSLVGRDQVLREIAELLRSTRLLTLTGPGGIGKTRLAVEAAREALPEFADGVCFIPLTSARDPALVSLRIAQALGIPETAGQSLTASTCVALRNSALLLVLDSFEQVAAAAPLIAELLAACPRLKLLVTSRVVLHLSGEREYAVPPLAAPEPGPLAPAAAIAQSPAVALFVQRAQEVNPEFTLTPAAVAVVMGICRRLDGLPLAIELAAARTKILSPQALLARLEHPLPLLTGGARNLPAHQQTLHATIAWSYDLLTPVEQTLFRRLAVFGGSYIVDAAARVCDAAGELGIDVFDGLASLVDQSLLVHREGLDGEPRFSMLTTLHEFAGEQLAVSGEEVATYRRHAAYLAGLAEEAEFGLRSAGSSAWIDRLNAERENFRTMVRWAAAHGEDALALGMVGGLELWFYFEAPIDGRLWTASALALAGAKERTLARARALHCAGQLAYEQRDLAAVRRYLEESVGIFRELGDTRRQAHAMILLGMAMVTDYAAGQAVLQESLSLLRGLGDAWDAALAVSGQGRLAALAGDVAEAQARYAESAELFRGLHDVQWVSINLDQVGFLALRQGDAERAEAAFAEALAICRTARLNRGTAQAVYGAGLVAERRGQEQRAGRLLGAAERIARMLGLARALRLQADYDRRVAATPATATGATLLSAWEEGRALTPAQAIAYALEEDQLTAITVLGSPSAPYDADASPPA